MRKSDFVHTAYCIKVQGLNQRAHKEGTVALQGRGAVRKISISLTQSQPHPSRI